MNVPEDLRYAESHEWLRADGTVGITDHAQHELTDVVFVDLPEIGKAVEAGQVACVVESVKAASDIYAPVSGKVVAVNEAVRSNPALVNTDPYGEGWLFKLEPSDASARERLKSPADYKAQIG
ncbi:MAG: glycine cleavage system protein GcvH [Verrucomicrobiota bacterium]|jgi:glycine cleavage system H protein